MQTALHPAAFLAVRRSFPVDSPHVAQRRGDGGGFDARGYVALVGHPNAGKSSLMNRLVEQKLSIVTPLAQTTRERVLGIDTRDGVQMVFVDTPGLVEPRYLLHRSMVHVATGVIRDADVVLLLIDAAAGVPSFADEVLELLAATGRLIVVSNKRDVASEAQRRAVRAWSLEHLGREPREVSATTGEGVESLRAEIAQNLPESPYLYPEDDVSSQPVRFFVVRADPRDGLRAVREGGPVQRRREGGRVPGGRRPSTSGPRLYVERPSQKAIVIGSGGKAIRRLGAPPGPEDRGVRRRAGVPGPLGEGAAPLAQGPAVAAALRVPEFPRPEQRTRDRTLAAGAPRLPQVQGRAALRESTPNRWSARRTASGTRSATESPSC
jgi:GTPase